MSRGNNNGDYFQGCLPITLLGFTIALLLSVVWKVITTPRDASERAAKYRHEIDVLMDECKIPGLEKCRSLIQKK